MGDYPLADLRQQYRFNKIKKCSFATRMTVSHEKTAVAVRFMPTTKIVRPGQGELFNPQ